MTSASELRTLAPALGAAAVAGFLLAFIIFGSALPAIACAIFVATFPLAARRHRSRTALALANDSWPRMIEELRLLTSSGGRSIPLALLEVGRSAPAPMRPAFASARREWALTTDFARTLAVLRSELADPTCDATCETLLIAHEIGGTGVDRRLADLAEDRRNDLRYRKEVRSRQAGVRFARRFVLIVPFAMACAGLLIGEGRESYRTPTGQLLVVAAIGITALCWAWAGRMLRLPVDDRVFVR